MSIVKNAGIAMAMFSGDSGETFFNRAFAELAGARDASFGGTFDEICPDLTAIVAEARPEWIAGRATSHRDRRLTVAKDGREEDIWIDLDLSPVVDEAGQVVAALAIIKPTSDDVRLAQRLAIAETAGGFGIFEWCPETGRVTASSEYRKLWGLEAEVPISVAGLVEMVVESDRDLTGPRAAGRGEPLNYAEYRHVMPETGEIRWIARKGKWMPASNSSRRMFFGVAIDITERKRAEFALSETNSRWDDLIGAMQEGFFIGEAVRDDAGAVRDLKCLEVNRAFETQFGLPPGTRPAPSLRGVLTGVSNETMAKFTGLADRGDAVEFDFQASGPEPRWYEARARRMAGSRVAAIILDITARKNAESQLRRSESRFRTLTQFIENHVWTAKADGVVDWANDRTYAYFGLTAGSGAVTNWTALLHPEDVASTVAGWSAAAREGRPYETEFRLKRRDGVYRWHVSRALPVRDGDGAVAYWIGTNTDIEDRKRDLADLAALASTLEARVEERTRELVETQNALRQSQKMEAIGNLTGGIAHDFNNLLQVINGNLELLATETAARPNMRRWLRNAMTGVERGATLASQLLSFGRRQSLAPRDVSLGRLLAGMREMLKRALGDGVQIEIDAEDDLWNTMIDPSNMESAVLNLAVNARDAMKGRGRLTLRARNARAGAGERAFRPDMTPGDYVVLAVGDEGPGIPPEMADLIFEPFFTTKPKGSGSGLGLSMVYGFVRQSGGYIRVGGRAGGGALIEIYLPRADSRDDASPAPDAPDVAGGSETILVVEDDAAVRETVIDLLRDLGYKVLHADNANAAFAIIERGAEIDLLFTDVVMPGSLTSAELVERLIQRQPETQILYTSGYTENAFLPSGKPRQRGELLRKPYSRESMARKIRQMLDRPDSGEIAPERSRPSAKSEPIGSSGGAPPGSGGRIQILVCEDEPLIRMNLVDLLEDMGHAVADAGDAGDAIKIASNSHVDLLITDIGLPDMSGLELARRLRSKWPELPVLIASGRGYGDVPPLEKPSGYLEKPFTMQMLRKALGEFAPGRMISR